MFIPYSKATERFPEERIHGCQMLILYPNAIPGTHNVVSHLLVVNGSMTSWNYQRCVVGWVLAIRTSRFWALKNQVSCESQFCNKFIFMRDWHHWKILKIRLHQAFQLRLTRIWFIWCRASAVRQYHPDLNTSDRSASIKMAETWKQLSIICFWPSTGREWNHVSITVTTVTVTFAYFCNCFLLFNGTSLCSFLRTSDTASYWYHTLVALGEWLAYNILQMKFYASEHFCQNLITPVDFWSQTSGPSGTSSKFEGFWIFENGWRMVSNITFSAQPWPYCP
jgi:hypothetical protein